MELATRSRHEDRIDALRRQRYTPPPFNPHVGRPLESIAGSMIMSTQAESAWIPYSTFEQLREAREIIRHEAETLSALSQRLDADFSAAVEIVSRCTGCVVVTGMGKAGL